MLGAVDRDRAARIVEAVATGDAAAIVTAVDALRESGSPAAGAVEETIALLQEMALRQAMPDASFDAADADEATVARLAPLLAADETQVLYSILVCGRAELALVGDEYGGLTMLLLRMLAFRPGSEGAAPGGGGAGTRQPEAAAPQPRPTAVVTAVGATRRDATRTAPIASAGSDAPTGGPPAPVSASSNAPSGAKGVTHTT